MSSVRGHVLEYFRQNQLTLSGNYPGLREHYLLEKFKEFSGANDDDAFSESYQSFFHKLESGVPLEYITGTAYFYRSEFRVNEHVLIPRFETEILVEKALSLVLNNDIQSIVEVGVGSGCITLSMAQELKDFNTPLRFTGTDISEEALKIAKENLLRCKSLVNHHQVEFIQADRLEGIEAPVDMIVTNPPYIKKSDAVHINTKFEPDLALFIEDVDYGKWYNQFFIQAYIKLRDGGVFLMEGHEEHLSGLQGLAGNYFTRTEILQDYTNRDRFLIAYR